MKCIECFPNLSPGSGLCAYLGILLHGLYIRMRIFLPVQLVHMYVVILLGYVAGIRISCCIFAGPLVGTPDVMS